MDPNDPFEDVWVDPDESWTDVDLWTGNDGKVYGTVVTNDNLDKGYASEPASWPVRYDDKETALKNWGGGSHRGCGGTKVRVRFDGDEIYG